MPAHSGPRSGEHSVFHTTTNIPSLVKTITTIPSTSDHDGAILVDSDIVPAFSKKKPCKTFVFSKANWSKMKEDPSTFVTSFLEALPETSVDENWEKIKGHLTSSMAKHIPSRTTSRKQHQPWITHGMKERTWKKHRMYRKARKSGNPDHMSAFWDYKKQSAKEMKKAKVRYVNERVLGELEDGNTKPFYRYIKSLRMDNIGLPPLKEHQHTRHFSSGQGHYPPQCVQQCVHLWGHYFHPLARSCSVQDWWSRRPRTWSEEATATSEAPQSLQPWPDPQPSTQRTSLGTLSCPYCPVKSVADFRMHP